MIVVVIIGILAAVAVPSYQGFQKRAKGSEAKVQLSSIYSGETAYFAELQQYSSNLESAGVNIAVSARYYNKIGFNAAIAPTGDKYYIGHGTTSGSCTTAGTDKSTCEATTDGGAGVWTPSASAPSESTCLVDNTADPKTFKACAEGDDLNSWSIDQSKNLAKY